MDPLDSLNRKLIKGMTQRELAAELGISASYLNDILSERREPGPALLKAMGVEKVTTYRRVRE